MPYTIERIQKEFTDICNRAGVQVTCPVKLNGRLKRTLGRVTSVTSNNISSPTLVEFSKQLLETCTDDTIWNVVAHEAAHYIATARTGENHGHNAYFKSICAEIGTSNDGTKTTAKRIVNNSQIYKYQVECPNCGIIQYAHRMGKNLKNIHLCTCGKCGSSDLVVVHNW